MYHRECAAELASNLSEIDVWRISKPGKTKEKKVPTGECICLKVEYTKEPIFDDEALIITK